jgi:outer membrane receptor protein involved in Fe transport
MRTSPVHGKSIAIPLILLACAPNAQAEASQTIGDLDEVQVTAQRREVASNAVAQWVTTLTEEQVEARRPQVMAEALRGEAGAFFQQTAPGQGMVIVRGLKGSEILHLVDGVRLNNAFFRTAPSQYVALLDPNNIGRIELLRGAAGTTYGSDAMGGVLQVLTPEERFFENEWDVRGKLALSAGSGDLARTARFSSAFGRAGLSLSMGASLMDFGNRKVSVAGQSADGRGAISLLERVGPTAYRARGYDAKLLWQPAPQQEWMLSLQHYAVPELPRYNEVVPGFGTASAGLAEAAESLYDNARSFAHLRYRAKFDDLVFDTVEVHAARQRITDDRFDRSLDLAVDGFENNVSTLDGLTLRLGKSLSARTAIDVGVDWYVDNVASSRREIRNGVVTNNGPNSAVKARFANGARSTMFGAYMLTSWSPTERGMLELSGRWDRVAIDLPIADRLTSGRFDDAVWAGGLGALLRVTGELSWVSNVRRGFRVPNINDLAQVGRRSNNRIVIANPNLTAESLWSFDTGLRWQRGRWSIEGDVYLNEYRDRITLVDTGVTYRDGENGCTRATGCIESINLNVAQARYYGAEAELWHRGDKISISATANYTFGEQKANQLTTPANRIPPLNGSIGASWRISSTWAADARLWFADRQDRLDATDRRDNRINPNGTPGYAAIDATLVWKPREGLELRATGHNLLDKSYREHGSGIDAVARSITLALDCRF